MAADAALNINGNVTWTGDVFSTAILCCCVPDYMIVSDVLGNYLRNSHVEGGRFAPARECLINMLGAKNNRTISPVAPDGFCGYGACEIINNFHGQTMGQEMQAGRQQKRAWIPHVDILDDLHADGKYNAYGVPPLLVIKFCVRCDDFCLSLQSTSSSRAACCPSASRSRCEPQFRWSTSTRNPVSARSFEPADAPRALPASRVPSPPHARPVAVLIIYEVENHPQVGGDSRGRHFEVMLPTEKFLAERAKLRESAAKPDKKRKAQDEFLENQKRAAEGFARANSAGSSAKGC